MINKIIEISNFAVFDSLKFTNGNSSDWDGVLQKNTVIYAPNGTGKTSLSLIFQSIQENNPLLIHKKKRIGGMDAPKISFLVNDSKKIEFDDEWKVDSSLNLQIFKSFYFDKNVYTLNLDDIFNEFIVENDSELKSQLETLQKKQKNLTKLRGRRKNNKYWIKLFEQDERKALDTSEKADIPLNIKSRKKENEGLDKKIDVLESDYNVTYRYFNSKINRKSSNGNFFEEYRKKMNRILEKFNDKIVINEIKALITMKGGLSSTLVYSLSIDGVDTTLQERNDISFDFYLSDGDKSAIAFSSFVARLELMGGTEERILIIDDPFTSFDSGRKQRTIDILARLSGKVKQMIVFTHDLDFGERISSKIFPKSDLLTLQMFSQNGSSNIRKINFSRELLTGLMKNITLLHDFLNNGVENEIEINNVHGAIRKSLEGIFRIKFFEFNKGNAWLGTYLECIEKSETEEEYKKFKRLLPYLQDLRDIASYSNQSHHDESIYGDRNIINSSELKSYVGETLEMIDKI